MDTAKVPSDVRNEWVEHIMMRYGTPVIRMCYLYLRDRMLAEEAMQDTFVKAYKSMDSFRGDSEQSEKAWVMRIAINVCKDYHKSAWFRHKDYRAIPDDMADASYERDIQNRALADAVMCLPKKIKEVVLLHYFQNLSYDEITVALNISRSTIYERLKKAKAILRDVLEGWEEND